MCCKLSLHKFLELIAEVIYYGGYGNLPLAGSRPTESWDPLILPAHIAPRFLA